MKSSHRKRSIILITGMSILIFGCFIGYFLLNNRNPSLQKVHQVNVKLSDSIIKMIDTSYWKQPYYALKSVNQLIKLSEESNDSIMLINALYYKASCYFTLELYDSVFLLCKKALKIAKHANKSKTIGRVQNVLANYYLVRSKYDSAAFYLMNALKIFEKQGSKKELGFVYNGFGLLYSFLNEPDKALSYLIKFDSLYKETGEKRREALANLIRSNCYFLKNEPNQTVTFLNKALTGFLSQKDSIHIITCYMNLGASYSTLKETKRSYFYYNQALDYLKHFNNKRLLGNTLFYIGVSYAEHNDLITARKYFLDGIDAYKAIGIKEGQQNIFFELSKIERRQNHWEKAYEYYISYNNLRDSIINEDLRKTIADLQWKYNFQKKENEAITIRKQYELKKKETSVLIISFVSFTLIALLIGILLRVSHLNLRKSDALKKLEIINLQEKQSTDKKMNKLEQLRLQAEIEAKNKELTTTSLQLITKNDILESISSIAERFYKKNTIDEEYYSLLKKILKENLDQERDWEHFKRLFESIHQDFFTRIKHVCPEITEGELRLCAYLKINLQNKEIAKLLNVTSESLKTLRYRIRKKFKLDKQAILEEYIRSI